MKNDLQQMIEQVKTAKATNWLHEIAKERGTMVAALDSLDCRFGTTAERMAEAVKQLSAVVKVSIFKRDGKVVVQ